MSTFSGICHNTIVSVLNLRLDMDCTPYAKPSTLYHTHIYTADVDNADLTGDKAVFILCCSYCLVKVNIKKPAFEICS
jgi:hypothetical protein